MLNKGLEIIEACRLFDVTAAQVRVTVHPQSTVHSLVNMWTGRSWRRFRSGYAAAHPLRARLPGAARLHAHLQPGRAQHLDFEPPDFERFPA